MSDNNIKIDFSDLRDISQQVRFQSHQGKIWLGEQRVVLMTLPAMGSFRWEVLNTLGVERAKGFFMRLGYHNGLKDAELGLKLRPHSNILDRFLVGPQIHMLRGMVKVEPLKIEFDEDSGHFFMEHIWVDSYEAEICLAGPMSFDQPVCWTLIGYACGYTSAVLGQDIIFKEIECRGCGDPRCRVVGKPAAEWDDHEEYRRYFTADPIIDELYDLQSQVTGLRKQLHDGEIFSNAIGQSKVFQDVCKMANRASGSKVSVLLTGETGVGKEVIARGLHLHSDRADEPFVALNCAAIPPDLIEAELFGVEKGAYTGATQSRMGRFERAHKGTIFLDEVVELTPRAQASLLRVLQESELERVGDNRVRTIDVRLIAATNEDLEQAVKEGRFRADLFYRLNVFPVRIPPLRERKDDIPLLAEHFLDKYHTLYNKKTLGLSNRAIGALMLYNWPGNIRELENIIERGIILTDDNESISVKSLFPGYEEQEVDTTTISADGELVDTGASGNGTTQNDWLQQIFDEEVSLAEVERELIKHAMKITNNNVSKAARKLGLSRATLDYRLTKLE